MEAKQRTSAYAVHVASCLSIIAFFIYNWKIFRGESHPNMSSWLVWAFITILNSASYKKLTGSWVKSRLSIVNAILTLITAVCAIVVGSAKGLSNVDIACLLIGILAAISWIIQQSPALAQIFLQIALVVGFVPTFIAISNNTASEPWNVWLLWTIAFMAQFVAVRSIWTGKTYIEFLYPVLMFICHGIVFLSVV